MKYKLNVNNQTYEVEIENINARPIVVTVDGQRFEVMPENSKQAEVQQESVSQTKPTPAAQSPLTVANPATGGSSSLNAPLPGTVVEVFVKAGDVVEAGQVVLVIEAMKMKNSIRSIRSGTIANVFVNQGQSVAHKQTLVEFAS